MSLIKLSEVLQWESEQTPKITSSLRASFDCEESSLNTYLSNYARQSDEQNSGRTWIELDKSNRKIVGYVSVANTSIEKNDISGVIKSHVNPIPALLIARLAVDKSYKGRGIGEKILLFAFKMAKEVNEISAIQAIVVDTLNEKAEQFYLKYGFIKIGSSNKMIISTKELFD